MSKMAVNKELSWHEWFRLTEAQRVITNSTLGVAVPIVQSQKRYIIWNDNQYRRLPYEKEKGVGFGCDIPKVFENASKVVFIGDSLPKEQKMGGGNRWFEPMMATLPDK